MEQQGLNMVGNEREVSLQDVVQEGIANAQEL